MAIANYEMWGRAEGTVSQPVKLCALEIKIKQAMLARAHTLVDLSDFKLAAAHLVGYYQGEGFNLPVGLLRFTREGKLDLGGEHVSFIFTRDTCQLLGITRMQKQFACEDLISPQKAVETMVHFLQQEASDLVPFNVSIPKLEGRMIEQRLDFEEAPLKIGQVELQWVGDHPEAFHSKGKAFMVHGLKVKMYLPKTGLWAWGIVAHTGEIITFERDICWNFAKFQRETQMWLHDAWLKAQTAFS